MKKPSALQVLLATLGIAISGSAVVYGAVTGISYLYGNGKTAPSTTLAGYLATADGGVVNVMGSPAPTAVGQALRSTATGTNATAAFGADPAATTTASGVVRLGTSARISATTSTSTASGTATTVLRSDTMCILPKATTSVWGVSEFSTILPLVDGSPSVGSGGLALQSNHIHPTEGAARAVYYVTGTGGVAPTFVSLTANPTADSFTHAVTSSWTNMFFDYDDTTAKAGLLIWPAGTYKIRMWLASANADGHTSVYPALAVGYSYALCSGGSVVVTSASLAAYDSYCTLTADKILSPSDYLAVSMLAQTTSSDTLTVGLGGLTSTSISVPWSPNVYWEKSTDLVRYAGYGSADPSQSPGVAAAQMSLYYQTIHSTDGGTSYGLWWKSGAGNTQWTELAQGSGGGGQGITLSSPNNTIAIGQGGGTTTVEVNYGTAAHTAAQGNDSRITGAEQTANRGVEGGYCPLDGSALVPVANLPAVTQSVAGAMSGADKTKLDGIASGAMVDTYQVQATTGTTPGFLDAVCESTDSSITIGQTGNYLTFDANFGTSATQVCSGSTCAAKQATLPGGTNGQALVVSATGTATSTNYQPTTLPIYTSMSLATQARIGAASGTASATDTQAMSAGAKVALATNARIAATTSTATALSTATDVLGSDARVIVPLATTTAWGMVQLYGSASIPSVAGTVTQLSYASRAMPADANAMIGSNTPTQGQVLFGASSATGTSTSTGNGMWWGYIQEGHVSNLVSDLAGKQSSLGTASQGYILFAGSTSTATNTTATPVWGPPPTSAVMTLATNARIAAGTGTASATATQAMPADAKVARSTQARITTTTNTATAASTATDVLGSDAQVILPVATTAVAGIVQLATSARIAAIAGTATASSTATQARPSDVVTTIGSNTPTLGMVLFGASAATGTSTSTGTGLVFGYLGEGHVVGLASDLSSLTDAVAVKQASLGTSTRGAVLYNGSTSTSTSTSSSPVWGPPPAGAAIDTATPTNVTAGAGSAGSNGKASDSGHIHHIGANTPTHGQWLVAGTDTTTTTNTTNAVNWATLPASSGSVAGVCAYGYTSGKCVQGDDYRLGNYGIRDFHSAQLASTVGVGSNAWTSVLSVSTSGSAGRIIAYGAITLTSNSASRCDARIVLDNYAGGDGPALRGVTDSNVQASLSPIYTTTFAAGAHTVNLQVLNFGSITCLAAVDYQNENFGSLIVQEFTN